MFVLYRTFIYIVSSKGRKRDRKDFTDNTSNMSKADTKN